MRTEVRVFGSVMRLTLLMDMILTLLAVRGGLVLSRKRTRRRASGEDKQNVDLAPIGPLVRRTAPLDPILEADSDACAREAVMAIEAVLDRRCPELKRPFWNAIDKLYRLDNPPGPRLAADPDPQARMLA